MISGDQDHSLLLLKQTQNLFIAQRLQLSENKSSREFSSVSLLLVYTIRLLFCYRATVAAPLPSLIQTNDADDMCVDNLELFKHRS